MRQRGIEQLREAGKPRVASTRILLVDDDSKFLRFVSEFLIGAGYDVHCTSDPGVVLEMTKAVKPALIILDIAMPGKDDFEVARELRCQPATKGVRFMFLTAHRASTHVKNAKEVGGAAYLEKPF